MTKETTSKVKRKLKLKRRDGKIVDVIYYNIPSNSYDDLQENIYPYNNAGIDVVEILDIKKLKFEGMKTKDIKKANIHNEVVKNEKSLDSSSKVSNRTFLSQYQVITYSINDIIDFVNRNVTNNYS